LRNLVAWLTGRLLLTYYEVHGLDWHTAKKVRFPSSKNWTAKILSSEIVVRTCLLHNPLYEVVSY